MGKGKTKEVLSRGGNGICMWMRKWLGSVALVKIGVDEMRISDMMGLLQDSGYLIWYRERVDYREWCEWTIPSLMYILFALVAYQTVSCEVKVSYQLCVFQIGYLRHSDRSYRALQVLLAFTTS
jgi:hypothetical protein